jgi:hypothetical protein
MNDPIRSESVARTVSQRLAIVFLRVALVAMLFGAGWFIYKKLPVTESEVVNDNSATSVQIILRNVPDVAAAGLDVPIEIYPVDIVAVRHEFFTEQRAGKRFEDFLNERMKGRSSINTKLDRQGQGIVLLSRGSWFLHATLSGDEEVEWRIPLTVTGEKQTVELTSQNAYTRSRSF